MTRDELIVIAGMFKANIEDMYQRKVLDHLPYVPAYYYDEHLDRVQTTWVPQGSKLKRWTPKKGFVEITATRYLHSEWEWLTVLIANYTKDFCYFIGEK